MKAIRSFLNKITIARDLILFLWQRKLWWLIPMIIVLLAFGILLIFAQSTGIAPFIYTLF